MPSPSSAGKVGRSDEDGGGGGGDEEERRAPGRTRRRRPSSLGRRRSSSPLRLLLSPWLLLLILLCSGAVTSEPPSSPSSSLPFSLPVRETTATTTLTRTTRWKERGNGGGDGDGTTTTTALLLLLSSWGRPRRRGWRQQRQPRRLLPREKTTTTTTTTSDRSAVGRIEGVESAAAPKDGDIDDVAGIHRQIRQSPPSPSPSPSFVSTATTAWTKTAAVTARIRGGGSGTDATTAVGVVGNGGGGGSVTTTATANSTTTTMESTNAGTTVSPALPAWKAHLPVELQRKKSSFRKLVLGCVDVYLLGTAHVSNDSSNDVRLLLEAVRPDAILVELCDARIPMLERQEEEEERQRQQNENNRTIHDISNNTTATTGAKASADNDNKNNNNKKKEPFWDRVATIRQSQGGSRLQALSTLLLTSVQEEYATDLDVDLGGEFQCAYRYWKAQRRRWRARQVLQQQQQQRQQQQQEQRFASPPPPLPPAPHLILGDRPLQLTLIRAWESLWWWPKIKVIVGLLWSSWRKPDPDELRKWLESVLRDESDVLTKSFQELKRHFPSLYRTIVSERDAWLAAKLTQTCRGFQLAGGVGGFAGQQQQWQWQWQEQQQQQRRTVVAIVGAGHVPGICKWMTDPPESGRNRTPEQVLSDLVVTKRWSDDEVVQREAIPIWVNEVSELQDVPDESFSWSQPTKMSSGSSATGDADDREIE